MAYIDDLQVWAKTIQTDEVSNTPQRLSIADNLWDKGWLMDVPVTTQHLNQLMYLITGAILEIPTENTIGNKIFDNMFHIGYVHTVIGNATNPSTYLGRGTWVAEGQGRVLVGAGQGTDANGVSKTFAGGSGGGEYEHDITIAELPSHDHNVAATTNVTTTLTTNGAHTHSLPSDSNGGTGTGSVEDAVTENPQTAETGSAGDHTHTATSTATTTVVESSVGSGSGMDVIQPYLTVYMWRRTA